jgi:hypothetical protein
MREHEIRNSGDIIDLRMWQPREGRRVADERDDVAIELVRIRPLAVVV